MIANYVVLLANGVLVTEIKKVFRTEVKHNIVCILFPEQTLELFKIFLKLLHYNNML